MISARSRLLVRTLARHAKQNSAWSKRYSSSSATTIASADRRPIKTHREAAFATLGVQAYPRYTAVEAGISVVSAQQVHERWDVVLADGEKDESVRGRIRSKREAGRRLVFYDIEQEGGRHVVQAVVSEQRCKNKESSVSFSDSNRILLAGDIVRVSGFVGKTRLGETSVFATCNPELLAPCLHTIPTRSRLEDTQKRFRNRHLDLLVNPHARKALETRARVLRFIRGFLDSRGFVEVETPVLSANVGGAAARPFVTRAVALGDNTPLFLRIAPELYLKQLVVGGFDRVYELGKQFRNEGIDADHNPEFTTCEFYQAYATVEDLMTMTEDVLREMSMEVTGSPKVNVGRDDGSGFELDFSQPFRRIHVTDTLYEMIPELPNDLDSPAALAKLVEIASKRGIAAPRPHTVPRLLDRFIGHIIEPQCEQPTFLTGHPGVMSPLAKSADAAGRTSARFELFANGRELVNAYEELNDPNEQRRKFAAQARERNDLGDEEVPAPDAAFCDALEFGLPPTGGWGMGVDRVVALLAGVRHLRETVSFALLKPGKQ
ncbi:lysyl-tRNA synthetase [Kickxella alabastrina]|uniref:lysyl-tRNA synthetase n=1 Tax=Kickxella alabastrina TaxID=61397 RepID=UPI00221F3B1B|nr:lysyl-tRNA synthetase [Kickxella alabastrina]KAI7833518.1 lysyl-tRNA synthetase [Kickxella alabastrina]